MFKKGKIANPKGGSPKKHVGLIKELLKEMFEDPTTTAADRIKVIKLLCKAEEQAFRRRVELAEERRNEGYKGRNR